MQIKTNVEVNHEEILAKLKPEELLAYLQKNHPSFCQEKKIEPKKPIVYKHGQWFTNGRGDYWICLFFPPKIHLVCFFPQTGYMNRQTSDGYDKLDSDTLPGDLYPINYKDIPKC